MKYISTRGRSPAQSFEEVLLKGLADDGGLYIPQSLPRLSRRQILAWKDLSYSELAFEIIRLFVADALPDNELRAIIQESYGEFAHPEVAPLRHLTGNEWVLELYHGPTLAFKDFALQLLGRLLDYFLAKQGRRAVILGATSGDTGSAALEGCRHSRWVDMYILHPHQRVSAVQRRQMTCVPGDNVNNIAIEGNFDDCQRLVKLAFADQSFLPAGYQLAAVNSINFARVMAQIVYYFYAALKFMEASEAVAFAVPTGNFGDIYAGYLARRMGLPAARLIIATNRNDILHRFISRNEYRLGALEPSLSPSMDIMASSNFERFLYDLFAGDGARVEQFVTGLSRAAQRVAPAEWERAREVFDSCRVDDEAICATIREVHDACGFLLDPHSATGVRAARVCRRADEEAGGAGGKYGASPMICLATAHPAKFAEAIIQAGLAAPALPARLTDLFKREERCVTLPPDLEAVRQHILATL